MTAPADALPALLHGAQRALLQALHTFGLAGEEDGQPAWPFPVRIAVETLALDAALARQVLAALAATLMLSLLFVLAWRWRRGRWPTAGLMVAVAAFTPWPAAHLLSTAAVPTSFHRSPSPFDPASIERGLALFQAHCASCHGADGRGDTPLAATLPVWPPRLSGGLLWKRAEGETYWRILHGQRGRDGRVTMPGFEGPLRPVDVWALIDGMKTLASGQSLRSEGRWAWPLAAPDLQVSCDGAPPVALSAWRGQRVRIVVAGTGTVPREDARMQTVLLADGGPGCVATDTTARRVFAALAGTDPTALAGTQFLVDRDGWLRALNRPGQGEWDIDDLLCRSGDTPAAGKGLDALIRRMDADPVRIALGMPHAGPR